MFFPYNQPIPTEGYDTHVGALQESGISILIVL